MVIAQMSDVLLDREAVNLGPFSAITIAELEARPAAPKELGLDHQNRQPKQLLWEYCVHRSLEIVEQRQ